MKAIRDLSAVFRLFPATLLMMTPGFSPAGEEPGGEAASGVVAEVWPFAAPAGEAAKPVFERWRASVPPAPAATVPLDGLSLPACGEASMTRVAGVLVPAVTGRHAFFVESPGGRGAPGGETELWIEEADTGAWVLAQRTGNPNKRSGRTWLEQGVARRFELWHSGREAVSIEWEVRDWDAAAGKPSVALARQTVPATALRRREAAGGDPRDAPGPESDWGDPDGDGWPNWQERLAGADPLTADTAGRAGLVRWELWRGIPGRHVFDLKRAADYPAGPREVRHLDRLEIPTGNGDAYGSRLRGLLRPPADGEYTLIIIADDTAELWLGENESWQTKRLVAQANQPPGSARLGWTRGGPDGEVLPLRAEQTARVRLTAGRDYYLEVLHKQDGGQDHCAVAWILPGANEPALIGGRHLVSWKPCPTDTDDDGLPDAWQSDSGLPDAQIGPSLRHAEADPDGDGATNRDEWLAGTNPLDRADIPDTGGMLLSEAWTGIPGRSVASLTGHPRFPAQPDVTSRIDNLDFGQEGDNYGVRLRGYLTAPADGPYHFSIAGNNACVLYLGESEDKFAKRLVARVEVGTQWRSFHLGGHLRSGPIPLERGKRYYIEVLFKRGEGGDGKADHSSVAWRRPGEQPFTVIGPEFFSPYRPDPRDGDGDDLPDEWEALHSLDPADPAGKSGSWGDPDEDGLENFREFQRGLDPNAADVHGTPGLALWEVWDNLEGLVPAHRDQGGIAAALSRDLRFPLEATRREWRDALDAPRREGANFAARLRGRIIAPVSGDYVFSIAGRDVGELFLSPDDSKFNRRRVASFRHGTGFRSWDLRAGQMTKPVALEAGRAYYIEAIYGRGAFHYDDDFLSIGWKTPGSEKFDLIGPKHLLAFFRDPNDQDDDDVPDDWEKANGLDPTRPDGDLDPDGDGLTNREECRLGTHPGLADTDGDGVSDLDEIRAYNSNPLVSDAIGDALSSVALDAYVSSSINWTMTSGGLLAGGFRGEATWNFSVPADGNWLLRLNTELMGSRFGNEHLPMVVRVDGQVVGRREVYFGVGRFGALQVLTQYLDEGAHQVSILVDNMLARRTVRLVSLKVHAPANAAALLAQGNRVINYTAATRTSPLCVEGYARDAGQVTVNGRPAANGMGNGHWYADIPLAAGDDLQSYAIQYEPGNGATGTVTWVATNALAGETLAIRRGDSLRVGAWGTDPAMDSTLTAADGRSWPLVGGQTEVLTFPGAGTFTFRGELRDGTGATLTVHVLDAPNFPAGTIDALDGTARVIACGAADAVAFDTDGELATLAVTRPDATSASVSLLPLTPAEFGIAARLGADGPILGVLRVNVIGVSDALQNSLTTQASSGIPGYKLYLTPLTVTNLPEGARVDVSILRAGVMFPNGSTLRSIFPGDLVNSAVRLEFLFPVGLPGAFCHQLLVYDRNGVYLGTH